MLRARARSARPVPAAEWHTQTATSEVRGIALSPQGQLRCFRQEAMPAPNGDQEYEAGPRPAFWHAQIRRTSSPLASSRQDRKSREGSRPGWVETALQTPVGTTISRSRLCRDAQCSDLSVP